MGIYTLLLVKMISSLWMVKDLASMCKQVEGHSYKNLMDVTL